MLAFYSRIFLNHFNFFLGFAGGKKFSPVTTFLPVFYSNTFVSATFSFVHFSVFCQHLQPYTSRTLPSIHAGYYIANTNISLSAYALGMG